MKGTWILPLLLLFLGFGIGAVSLYEASVAGFMKQMGLVGADFEVTMVKERIEGMRQEIGEDSGCDLLSKGIDSVKYVLSKEPEKIQMAFELGEQRMECGVRMLADERVSEGTYEIVKGMGYIARGYQLIGENTESQPGGCGLLSGEEKNLFVNRILTTTTGKVYEIISAKWRETEEQGKVVRERCFAEQQEMR